MTTDTDDEPESLYCCMCGALLTAQSEERRGYCDTCNKSEEPSYKQVKIGSVWLEIEQELDISTEQLIARVCDICDCEIDEMVDALMAEGIIEDTL